jgi:hypothetical protein
VQLLMIAYTCWVMPLAALHARTWVSQPELRRGVTRCDELGAAELLCGPMVVTGNDVMLQEFTSTSKCIYGAAITKLQAASQDSRGKAFCGRECCVCGRCPVQAHPKVRTLAVEGCAAAAAQPSECKTPPRWVEPTHYYCFPPPAASSLDSDSTSHSSPGSPRV